MIRKNKIVRVRAISKHSYLVHSGSFVIVNENTDIFDIEAGVEKSDYWMSGHYAFNIEKEKINKGKNNNWMARFTKKRKRRKK